MGLLSWLFQGRGHGTDELARRLGMRQDELETVRPRYREFYIPKRSGGERRILAPDAPTKSLQRRILRRLLARLKSHPAAMGFERGRSIVTNARSHQGQAVVMRFDVKDFFPSTRAERVKQYFRRIGWNRPAAELLTRLSTHDGGLPQGAPTSPRLSNLVNHRLDARLAGMAAKLGGVYTRYADDITISFGREPRGPVRVRNPRTGAVRVVEGDTVSQKTHYIAWFLERVLYDFDYRVHRRQKRSIRRRHQQQLVTGLVVNDRANLPRAIRRWLRAVEHRTQSRGPRSLGAYEPFQSSPGREPTLSASQLEGWQSLRSMVRRQG
jgi:hypothetical protein